MGFDVAKLLRPGLLLLIPALNALGFALKRYKRAKGRNFSITACLYVFGVAVAALYGLMTSQYEGWRYVVDALVVCGACQGLVCAGVSTKGYDAVMLIRSKKEAGNG